MENTDAENQVEMNDEEIAELAAKELRRKEQEIAKLKKELAKTKLLSTVEDEANEPISREDCIKTLSDTRTTNYDYAEAVVGLVDYELAEGNPNPLGKNGQEVYDFFKDVLDECDGDKARFTSVYQSRLGADDKSIAMAYSKRKNN